MTRSEFADLHRAHRRDHGRNYCWPLGNGAVAYSEGGRIAYVGARPGTVAISAAVAGSLAGPWRAVDRRATVALAREHGPVPLPQ